MKDGNYSGASDMVIVATTRPNGTAATCNHHTDVLTGCIIVQAVNDGAVDVSGSGVRNPFKLDADYWLVEGIDFHSSSGTGCLIQGVHNIFRRNVCWDAPDNTNNQIIQVNGVNGYDTVNAIDNLIEDVGSFGYGRKAYEQFNTSGTTFRRVWGRTERSINTGPKRALQDAYHSKNAVVDNAIFEARMGLMPSTYVLQDNGANFCTGTCTGGVKGAACPGGGNICTYPGTALVQGIEGWIGEGEYIAGVDGANVDSNTKFKGILGWTLTSPYDGTSQGPETASTRQGFFTHKDHGGNDADDIFIYIAPGITNRVTGGAPTCLKLSKDASTAAQSTMDRVTCIAGGAITPGDNVSSWTVTNKVSGTTLAALGSGSFYTGASGANTGAIMRYRYREGVLTGVPLWPWPMSARIKAATTKASTDGHGHAIADVDAQRQGIFGLSPDETTPTPTLTSTPTNTFTKTSTPTNTSTPSRTPTNTPSRTNTNTPSLTPTPSQTPTLVPTNTPPGATFTPTLTSTVTPTLTRTPTFTRTPSLTPTAGLVATPACTQWVLCGDGWLHIRFDCSAGSASSYACGPTPAPTVTPTPTVTP